MLPLYFEDMFSRKVRPESVFLMSVRQNHEKKETKTFLKKTLYDLMNG